MPFTTDTIQRPVHMTGPQNILARADDWGGHSYTAKASAFGADSATGLRFLYPGTLVLQDPADGTLIPATSAHVSSYKVWPTLAFYDLTYGNAVIDVVERGEVVEHYCYGFQQPSSYQPVAYGTISSAVKEQLPMILWK